MAKPADLAQAVITMTCFGPCERMQQLPDGMMLSPVTVPLSMVQCFNTAPKGKRRLRCTTPLNRAVPSRFGKWQLSCITQF
jgi:hypothetical protein